MSHFWDEEKVVGRWLGDDPGDVIPDSASLKADLLRLLERSWIRLDE